jgi:hypothetical protein
MTAAELADHLHARRVGSGRWQARCPAHDDGTPSLSLREGRAGRTVLCCHAGCSLTSILTASGLHLRDLFDGPPLSPAQARQAAAERRKREQQEQQQRDVRRAARDIVWKWESIVNELGARLARTPDDEPDDALTVLFHQAMNRLHEGEMKATSDE